ncbi:MAG: DUF6514 family protein [Eubacteriales bacterium]|nr:DUF6514 family protein [Eubacteriales bacterium]
MTIRTEIQEVKTFWGEYKLRYELLQSGFEGEEGETLFYGIRIRQYAAQTKEDSPISMSAMVKEEEYLVDNDEFPGITEDFSKAKALFYCFVEETVMPVHLCSLVDDWQTEEEKCDIMSLATPCARTRGGIRRISPSSRR